VFVGRPRFVGGVLLARCCDDAVDARGGGLGFSSLGGESGALAATSLADGFL
jgi:hypothetical protein